MPLTTTLTPTVSSILSINYTDTAPITSANLVTNVNKTLSVGYTNGTGSGQVDSLYMRSGNFTASTAIAVKPITATGLLDAYGHVINMARVKTLYFANLATSESAANTVTIGAGTQPMTSIFPSTSTITIPAGGSILLNAPLATAYVVTSGSADTLTFTPGAGTPAYEMIIMGCSA
jgi:hypothetical protein